MQAGNRHCAGDASDGSMDVVQDEAARDAAAAADVARRLDRALGEVDAGDAGAKPGPRERVETDVALHMEQRASPHVAKMRAIEVDRLGQVPSSPR